MNIANFISELLFNYECVVLPGLGGFITNPQSATINRITHQFNPPYNQIFFNKHLTANDGLLVRHIAYKKNVSYETARNLVDVFVKSTQLRLESGEKVHLENIGTLEYDSNQNIRFEQSTSINYNPESFGLTSLISPSIRRKTDEEKLRGLILSGTARNKSVDRKTGSTSPKRKKGFVRSSFIIAMLAFFVFSLSWALVEREQVSEYWQEQASLLPFNNSNEKYQPRNSMQKFNSDRLVELENLDKIESKEIRLDAEKEVAEDSFNKEKDDALTSTTTNSAEDISLTETEPESVKSEDVVAPKVKSASKLYYVVAGSFSNEVNASKLVAMLRKKGYNAMIADTTKKGMFRVAYLGVEDLDSAKQQLYAIRQEDNPEAWIFRK